jgi:hypothetical protein
MKTSRSFIQQVLLLLFVFIATTGTAQSVFDNANFEKYPYHLWDSTVINACNTAVYASSLSQEERDLIWLTNLARFDAPLFSKTFLKQYIEDNEIIYTDYVKSLFSDMKSTSRLSILIFDANVCNLAKEFAVWSGKKGSVGHQKFAERSKKSQHSRFGENCQYGESFALDILMRLLIDEGVVGVGHRKNILNPAYTHIGLAIQPHKNFKYVCVMDFGG